MNSLKLYLIYIKIYLKTKIEYRFAFFTDLLVQALVYVGIYLSIWIIFNKFHDINGWNLYEVLFLYNLNMLSYSISGLFFWSPSHALEGMVQQGSFDSILIRPINPFLNMILRGFNHGFLGSLLLGIITFALCIKNLNIFWTLDKIIWIFVMILGSIQIQAAIMISTGALCFWFIKSSFIVDTAIYGVRRLIDYPIFIYDKLVQVFITFIIPYAFVNYYPSQYLLNKTGEVFLSPYFRYGTPIVGLFLFCISYAIWKSGLSKYQSTGS